MENLQEALRIVHESFILLSHKEYRIQVQTKKCLFANRWRQLLFPRPDNCFFITVAFSLS